MKLSWDETRRHAEHISKAVRSCYDPEILVGISVGGLVPTSIISHLLDNKNVLIICAYSYKGKHELLTQFEPRTDSLIGKKVLLIDDIRDTGETLDKIKQLLLGQYGAKEVRTAALLVRKDHCDRYPDFWARETNEWVDFPWEVTH